MSRARILLHLAALVAPIAAATMGAYILGGHDTQLMLRETLIFGALGTFAAQIAVWSRWRALERRVREGSATWRTGVGIAAITHGLFGALFVVAIVMSLWLTGQDNASSFSQLVLQGVFFTLISVATIGLVTFPLTMLVVTRLGEMRRKELADGNA